MLCFTLQSAMCFVKCLVLLFLIVLPDPVLCDSVQQSKKEMIYKEGEEVTLQCTYETSSSNIYLYWYRVYDNRAPQYILDKGAKSNSGYSNTAEFAQQRFSSTADDTSTTLTIRQTSLPDSAIYYCALYTTGLGNKLMFGTGTQLTVLPNIQKNPPSVYILQPKDSRSDISPVCLVTDFAPRQIDVSINEHRLNESDASVLINDKSYGVVGYLKRTEGKFSCIATNELKSVPGKPDTTPGDQCVNMDDIFETDEKLNFMSLATLGLRIIFLKSIIFNVLMTVHAMSS